MNKQKLLIGLIVFILGIMGVLSILTMKIPIPAETEAILKSKFTEEQIQWLILFNPTVMLLISVVVGTLLYQKVNFKLPIIEHLVGLKNQDFNIGAIFKYGLVGGIMAGILMSLIGLIFKPMLPQEFVVLSENLQPTLAARFLYGGLTEEILLRFGFMTFVVWLISKISKNTEPYVYWIGIFISSLVFAIGHFPIAFQAVKEPSIGLLSYVLIGNTIGGLIFGWLYWKKGLESAFLAHIFAHVIMVIWESMG